MQPKISVLMSVYNSGSYLAETMESILGQSFSDYEFLIIDDASSDNSRELLQKYNDPRIRLFFNDTNLGLTASLNLLLTKAAGKYLARIDSDDIVLPERFAKQVATMEENLELLLLGTNCIFINEKSEVIRSGTTLFPEEEDLDDDFIRWSFLFPENLIVHSSVMLRAEVLLGNRLRYDEKERYAQDIEFWRRLTPFGKFRVLAEPLVKLRIVSESITSRKNSHQTGVGIKCSLLQQSELLGEEVKEEFAFEPEHLVELFRIFCKKRPESAKNCKIRHDFARRLVRRIIPDVMKNPGGILQSLRVMKASGIALSEFLSATGNLVTGKLLYLLHEKRKMVQTDNSSE